MPDAVQIAAPPKRPEPAPARSAGKHAEQSSAYTAQPEMTQLKSTAEASPATERLLTMQRQADASGGGLPQGLRSGVEQLSGVSMGGVRVHRNSSAPARVGALAYAQGQNIHLGPGQDKHLPHEAWHVAQQAKGDVRPQMQMAGLAINADTALEREADVMGAKAAAIGRDPAAGPPPTQSLAMPKTAGHVAQPLMGFEIEMLVLIDNGGRPIPEKAVQGTVGPHITIDVDHGPAVAASTPAPAYEARYDVDTSGAANVGKQVEVQPNAAVPEQRPALGALDTAAWTATTDATAHAEFTRPNYVGQPAMNNAELANIDGYLAEYEGLYRNWEAARLIGKLMQVSNSVQIWKAAHSAPWFYHPSRRRRYFRVKNALTALNRRANTHMAFWNAPANQAIPGNFHRAMRTPAVGAAAPGGPAPAGPWAPYQPGDGMGGERYASIVELVTNAYAPETVGGAASIMAAMGDALTFANAVQGALPGRVPLNTMPNVAGVGAGVHIGNPTQANQTTDGSVQATGALDLAQLPSYMLSIAGTGGPNVGTGRTNTLFNLKHHSDSDDSEGDRVKAELPLAVANASAAVNAIKTGGEPSLNNLRGLVALICQYMRLGRHFFTAGATAAPLDKNIVPLLSRTDLSIIFQSLVTPAERTWLTSNGNAHLNTLMAQIIALTGRNAGAALFNDNTDAHAHAFGPNCQAFLTNVFTAGADGVTGTLGGFRQLGPENVDPGGARAAEAVGPAANREGMVFELRNMIKTNTFGSKRFPRGEWARLAAQQIGMFQQLNARNEAAASQDMQVRYSGWGGAGGAGFHDNQTKNEPAW